MFIPCKFEEPIEIEGPTVSEIFSSLYVYGENIWRSRASDSEIKNRIWPEFDIVDANNCIYSI